MAKNRKVGIIGHFGGKENFLDGQTVKTKILYEELKNATDWKFVLVDTYYKKKNVFKLIFQTLHCLFSCKDIFVLLSGNGMRVYFPILSFFARKFGKKIYHNVIGANLDLYVAKYPKFKQYLNSFVVNWVETTCVQRALLETGIFNVSVMPNFKNLKILSEEELIYPQEEPYKLCTFSRVMKEKGIEDAVQAVKTVNENFGRVIYTLDIYGQVDENQIEWFENLQKNFPKYIHYGGFVDFYKSVEVLKNYFALLFPTRFYTEGIPGTIIDAYASGLPVIASRWEGFADIIQEGKTGFGYSFERVDELISVLEKVRIEKAFFEMKKYCLKEAEKYKSSNVVWKLVEQMETI